MNLVASHRLAPVLIAAAVTSALVAGGTMAAATTTAGAARRSPHVNHVLLISVDGLHQSDLATCVSDGLCPNLAELSRGGTTYTHASTSHPSDSSPGLMALVTGATPKLTGVYYDDAYDRTLYTPAAQTATGTQNCSGAPGLATTYEEAIDTNAPSVVNKETGTRTILGERIDPAQLAYGRVKGKCIPILPSQFLRTNSIFSVVHAAGLRTAWADKHPAADQQVAGHGTPDSVDDPFETEINADIIPRTLVDTRGRTVRFPLPNPTGDPTGYSITDSVGNTEAYDQIKVDAILNEIDGFNSAHRAHVGTPALFGMNFQTVSVAQKLVDPVLSCVRSKDAAAGCDPGYVPGGYEPQTLAFTPQMQGAVASVDAAIGAMVAELRIRHLLTSTEIIISAKHGQSPIDPAKLHLIGGALDAVLTKAGINVAASTEDDIALLWLKDQSQTAAAVAALEADKDGPDTARISYVLSGRALRRQFGNPLTDARTPDIIVQPVPGTIYSSSKAKVAEHGGFAPDDSHVALLVVNGATLVHDEATGAGGGGRIVTAAVQTTQVAPTILEVLGLRLSELDAVRIQHVHVLPAVGRF